MKSTKRQSLPHRREIVEPMHTMLRRYEEIEKPSNGYPPVYQKPDYLPDGVVERVAHAVAEWNLSDPFTYGRTALYLRQGYLDAEKTEADYRNRTLARRAAKRAEVDAMKARGDI